MGEMRALGRYTVMEEIGKGGMGVVYRALDPSLGREVAVKVLRDQTAAQIEAPAKRRARLLCEARTLAQLAHPNVVSVFDLGVDDDGAFVTMELVEGMPLHSWLLDHRTDREILDVFIGAGRGLASAHGAGIVHRDFKPGNVLVGADGRARVIDFGLSQGPTHDSTPWSEPIDVQATATGIVWGTPRFMAPEQLRGDGVDEYCDQYSFCVALAESLGRVPLAFGLTVNELLGEKAKAPRRPRAISRAVWKVLRRGLDPDPHKRWRSMHALVEALTQAAQRHSRPGLWAPVALALVCAGALSFVA